MKKYVISDPKSVGHHGYKSFSGFQTKSQKLYAEYGHELLLR